MTRKERVFYLLALLPLMLFAFTCDRVNREDTPVILVATAEQILSVVDLFPPANDSDCDNDVVSIEFRNIVKRPDVVDIRLLDIRLHTKRTTYRRTDGGTVVPSSHTQAIGALIPASGQGAGIGSFIIFEPDTINRPPFAALHASEFGLDPETGRPFVRLSVTEEYFGETLAGHDVSTSVTYPLTICAFCGGCG